MSIYSFLLIDNNDWDVKQLQELLNQLPIPKQIDVCRSVNEALIQLINKSYDLVFLDINLPDQSGVAWLRNLPRRVPVIITTISSDYAVECYDLDIADFLVKPFSTDRLQRAIHRALLKQHLPAPGRDARGIFLYVNRQLKRFMFEDISYLEAYGAYTKIYTQEDIFVIGESISWLEERLPARQFMRIQKSFMINLDQLTALERRFVWLSDIKLPIGKNYHDVLAQLVHPQKSGKATTSGPASQRAPKESLP